MKRIRILCWASPFMLLAAVQPVWAQPPVKYVGEIIIRGNRITPDSTILEALALYSGQEFVAQDVLDAEARLIDLGIFRVDPEQGVRPSVTVLDGEGASGPFKDILVRVQEKPWEDRIWIRIGWSALWLFLALLALGLTWRLLKRWSRTEK
jgi:hypothetical protein